MTRILFSILFQVQSNLLCTIISKVLPFPLNLLRIIIYALFISIQNISAKIPYKLHLGYYYQQNQWYLIGLNFLLSCYLHVSSFPIFTGILWLLLPWYLLNSIPREPPRFVVEGNQPLSFSEYLTVCRKAVFQKDDGRIGRVVVTRESYLMHIQVEMGITIASEPGRRVREEVQKALVVHIATDAASSVGTARPLEGPFAAARTSVGVSFVNDIES